MNVIDVFPYLERKTGEIFFRVPDADTGYRFLDDEEYALMEPLTVHQRLLRLVCGEAVGNKSLCY